MSEEYSPSVSEEVSGGPSLEEQAVELGIVGSEDGHPGDPVPVSAEEGLILGKFATQEDLEQAYTNLEYHMGQQSNDMSQPLTQASEYFAAYGSLSDEHYASLDQVGLNRNIVDSYISGAMAQQAQQTNGYFNNVGGAENYQAMTDWMTQYLPNAEIDAYNRVMTEGNPDEINMLMTGMYSRYQSAYSQNYEQVQGATEADQPLGFESRGQVMEALNDPRYESDSAYREAFEAKLAVTPDEIF